MCHSLTNRLIHQSTRPRFRLNSPSQNHTNNFVSIYLKTLSSHYFEITVQVETFTGPHNPPNHEITLTVNNESLDWKLIRSSSRYPRLQRPRQCRQLLHSFT
ncbi:DUF3888 domain-containing protein [Paenibacillus glacialis]|uniref:DUF3888 domain-containing protein n=1 Tax=Paenibacillus glacialis TaxID=494026 RepID=UPI0009FFC072